MDPIRLLVTTPTTTLSCKISSNPLIFTQRVNRIACEIKKQEIHFTAAHNCISFTPAVNKVSCSIVEHKITCTVGRGGVQTSWTYVQEAVPIGGEGYTWFQPSTGYGHVWIAGLADWFRFLTENMTADSIDHSIVANGGYY